MFGWRRRIGLISPTALDTTAYEFYQVAPEGVGLVAITCNLTKLVGSEFDQVLAMAYPGAEYLASRGVDYIIHQGGPPVMSRGKGFDLQLMAGIQARTGLPTTTTVRSAMNAMTHLGMRRVALVTPYPEEVHALIAGYLAEHGFDVVAGGRLPVPYGMLHTVAPGAIYRVARTVMAGAPAADGLFMPCAEWPVCGVVDVMERDFGRPVVVNDYANFWAAFSALGLHDAIRGHGRLLASLGGR